MPWPKGKPHPNKDKHIGGRTEKTIDYKLLDSLCKIQCTGQECADILDIHYDNLNEHLKRHMGKGFTEYAAIKGAGGKRSLRHKQFQLAMKGDRTMLIWLGKQYLGQAEKHELSGPGGAPIKTNSTISMGQLSDAELDVLEKLHNQLNPVKGA
jgi:hypothetical protein